MTKWTESGEPFYDYDVSLLDVPDNVAYQHALWEQHGKPRSLNAAGVLRAAGMRNELHPHDCVVYAYPTKEAFGDFAEANRFYHGNTTYGPYETEVGWVGIVDFRRQLAATSHGVTDPLLPDDYHRPGCGNL